jgi:alpha-L-fucosidase 2
MGSAPGFVLLLSCRSTRYNLFFAEWKLDKDSPTDTHRHLSHLIGLYPGYALATYDETTQGGFIVNGSRTTYTKKQLLDAATVSLLHRGNGRGPDADAGWEKAWRAAAWAQLGNAERFYHELSVSPCCSQCWGG